MSSPAQRVARRFVAAYFNVGDVILWGRWKNKKGLITAIGQDGKGNPTVTIEPIPKGRKQNKTFSLFKIWKMPNTDGAVTQEKTASTLNSWGMPARSQGMAKSAVTVLRPNTNLADIRKRKQELFDSLKAEELETLQTVSTKSGVMGRMGDADIVYKDGKNYEKKPLGLAATRLVKAGWLRHADGPSRDGFGWFHLTTAGENALRAFAEGSKPLFTKTAMSHRVVARYQANR